MSAIRGPAAPHGLREDFFSFVTRGGPQVQVHFSEQLSEFRRYFAPPLVGNRGGLERLHADRLLVVKRAAEQQFGCGSLRRG
jgi:hypothetical protein